MARVTGSETLATILMTQYFYDIIDIGVNYVLLNQTGRYIVDVQDDLEEIMHVYPSMEYVRYEVSQSPEGILITLV